MEQVLEDSSHSEPESTPTITIQATDEDLDAKDESREGENGSGHTINIPLNSIAHGGTFEAGATIPVQYQLKTESGVTYRVVQVVDNTADNASGHHMVAAPISSNSGVAQTIIAQNQLVSNASTGTAGDGPFYVMMTPSQEIVTHTSLRKRTSSASEGSRNPRDEKRRATHNEVERRRRDKINNWITKLAGIVPDCAQDRTKQGQIRCSLQSKGGILAKACEYINQLVKENSKLTEVIKENEILSNELDSLRLQLLDVKKENRQLKTTLQRHGLQTEES